VVEKKKGTGLKWIQITDLHLIPRELVEMLDGRPYDIDDFYRSGPIICGNPLSIVGVFANENSLVKGYMWASINPLEKAVMCHALVVDPKYRKKGIVREAVGILNKIRERIGIERPICFLTRTPELFERAGAVRSERIFMEVV
jgi:GNAT superfamily N-acetyltransferase